MEILGVSVMIYCVFLLIVGILLFFYTIHGLNIEGFAGSSGSGSGSGSYMSPLTAVYVKDCTVVSTCVSIGKDTDRLTYLQRLPVEGKLISTNGRYVFKYMSTGMVMFYDIGADSRGGSSNILWSSNTQGASASVPAYLRNLGNIEAIATDGSTMPWIAVPKPDPTGSGSGSGSGSSGSKTVSYAIPAIPNSGQYLQVTNYGDLVVMSPAGSIVWKANASAPPRTLDDPDACVPEKMTYPFTTKDCYQLDVVLKKNAELLTSLITYGVSCKAGYYCPDNSTSDKENACPAGTYCPENTKLPISCGAGYYCPPQSEMQNACTIRGYYCPAGAISATQNACINMGVAVSTFAGSGTAGFADGTGPAASFNSPSDIVFDSAGNAYVAESVNHRIRKITPAGVVTTFAGTGTAGFLDGPAATAQFNNPYGLAFDSAGSLYVADTMNNKVRKITGGVVSTFSGTTNIISPTGLAFNSAGTLYVSSFSTIYTITPAGIVTTFAGSSSGYVDGPVATAKFNGSYRIAIDSTGSLYIAESVNRIIRKITGGIVSTLAGSGVNGYANGTGTAAIFSSPNGITVDSQGNIYVSESANNHLIRKITPAGVVTTFAGTGIQGFSDSGAGNFYSPAGVRFDSEGNLYVADRLNHRIRKIREDCNKVTGNPLACSAKKGEYCSTGSLIPSPCTAGNICTPTGQTPCTGAVGTYCPAGATAPVSCDGMAAPGNYCPGGPAPITQCQAGYYCAGGTSQPVACTSVNLKGSYCPAGTNPWTPTMASNIKKCIYQSAIFTFAGSGTAGFADGAGPAAQFNTPGSLAVDSLGNIYMADTYNHCIRKITPGGVVSTLAGKGNPGFANGAGTTAMFNAPLGIAVDSAGNIYVADTYNHTIRKINSAGIVSTFAGSGNSNIYGSANGAGSAATFYYPSGIAIDSAGSVYVCDYGNTTIRKITSAGVVTTLAGSTTSGSADGTGAAASFYSPTAVAVDSTGNVYVTDTGNSTIRKITSAGVVTTLAGTPMLGSTGSFADGVGAAARFNRPNGIAVGSAGRIYVADTLNNKIRLVIGSNVTTHAGSVQGGADSNITNGVMTDGTLKRPGGLVVITGAGSTDTVYVSDLDNNKIRKVVLIPDCDKITGLPLPCNTGSIPAGSYCLGGIIL